jgi:4-hydroxy-4-methyl-2-oxoglutarate aldolase
VASHRPDTHRAWPVAALADGRANAGVMDHGIKPIVRGWTLWGPAATVRVAPGDAYGVIASLARVEPGAVLVVDAGGEQNAACLGADITLALKTRGAAGVVVDGGIRDVPDLLELDFPVFARSAWPGVREGDGDGRAAGIPITCGGVPVRPGDYIAGDADGVIVIPAGEVGEAVGRAREVLALEAEWQAKLRAGDDPLEVWGVRRDAGDA